MFRHVVIVALCLAPLVRSSTGSIVDEIRQRRSDKKEQARLQTEAAAGVGPGPGGERSRLYDNAVAANRSGGGGGGGGSSGGYTAPPGGLIVPSWEAGDRDRKGVHRKVFPGCGRYDAPSSFLRPRDDGAGLDVGPCVGRGIVVRRDMGSLGVSSFQQVRVHASGFVGLVCVCQRSHQAYVRLSGWPDKALCSLS
jgi:hypothetical protein